MGSSEDPSLVNNVDELGLVYEGLNGKVSGQTTTPNSVLFAHKLKDVKPF